jgi:hypothetical protein
MTKIITAVFLCGALWAAPAGAQTRVLDCSKPMTGMSRYVFNPDGTPVELGVSPNGRSANSIEASAQGAPPLVGCSGTECGPNRGPSAAKTEHVSGYTRRDGTYVGSYFRAPARR